MKYILFAGFLFFQTFVFAQTKDIPPKASSSASQKEVVTTPANFPSGNAAFQQLLGKNFNSRNVGCEISGVQSTTIEFTVEADGTVNEIKSSGSNPSLNTEAIRVVKSIDVKWNPAISEDGKNIRSRFMQPFKFVCE